MANYERQDDLPPRSDPDYMKLYRAKHKERLSQQRKKWIEDRPTYWKDTYDADKAKTYRETNREQLAERRWRSRGIVGITYDKYLHDLARQDGKCMICDKIMDLPHVDHDHESGLYRALLCVSCNNGLGVYEKNKDAFEAYLKNFSKMVTL
jgi:hypothetical protein